MAFCRELDRLLAADKPDDGHRLADATSFARGYTQRIFTVMNHLRATCCLLGTALHSMRWVFKVPDLGGPRPPQDPLLVLLHRSYCKTNDQAVSLFTRLVQTSR